MLLGPDDPGLVRTVKDIADYLQAPGAARLGRRPLQAWHSCDESPGGKAGGDQSPPEQVGRFERALIDQALAETKPPAWAGFYRQFLRDRRISAEGPDPVA